MTVSSGSASSGRGSLENLDNLSDSTRLTNNNQQKSVQSNRQQSKHFPHLLFAPLLQSTKWLHNARSQRMSSERKKSAQTQLPPKRRRKRENTPKEYTLSFSGRNVRARNVFLLTVLIYISQQCANPRFDERTEKRRPHTFLAEKQHKTTSRKRLRKRMDVCVRMFVSRRARETEQNSTMRSEIGRAHV